MGQVSSTDFPGHYDNEDNSWSLEKFKQSFNIKIHSLDEQEMNFDVLSVDTSIANAFRRIMIAEIPTVAFETINIYNNTSIIADEVLAQRLGLIPLKIDPDLLQWFDPSRDPGVDEDGEPRSKHNDTDTIVFSLDIKCERNTKAPKVSTDPNELYINSNVYARDLKFEMQGRQSEWLKKFVQVLNPDILIAKLRPGQEIILEAYAILGIGSDHAKFSPVATAAYRLLPVIDIIGEPITGGYWQRNFRNAFLLEL